MNTLSDAEWAVMEILWEHESCTLGKISEILAVSKGWRKNTVYTYLTRMEVKGLVSIDKSCTPHRYSYAVSREICAKAERSSLLQKVYKGAAGDGLQPGTFCRRNRLGISCVPGHHLSGKQKPLGSSSGRRASTVSHGRYVPSLPIRIRRPSLLSDHSGRRNRNVSRIPAAYLHHPARNGIRW